MVPGIPGSIVPKKYSEVSGSIQKVPGSIQKSPRKIPGIKKFQEIQKVPGTRKVPGSLFKDPGIFPKTQEYSKKSMNYSKSSC